MNAVNVLIIFSSRSGRTERLALAAAVGAVQARASIRIRRLSETEEDSGELGPALARMRREYVSPTRTDTIWADAVIIAINGQIRGMLIEPDAAAAYGQHVVVNVRACKGGAM